jgi:hypothetical protein
VTIDIGPPARRRVALHFVTPAELERALSSSAMVGVARAEVMFRILPLVAAPNRIRVCDSGPDQDRVDSAKQAVEVTWSDGQVTVT